MDGFSQKAGRLHCEGVPADDLAREYGTPLYVYSRSAILQRFNDLKSAFRAARPLICYSVKANGNLSILRMLGKAGSGFDVVTGGELFRALRAGAAPEKIVYAGVGKTAPEIEAALKAGILMFNVESAEELSLLNRTAKRLGKKARAALRLNPDVDARTHAKTTTGKRENKFGIDLETAAGLFRNARRYPDVELSGLHVHLGSPIYTTEPYTKGLRKAAAFLDTIRSSGSVIKTMNIGGGYAISYDGREVIGAKEYAAAILPIVKEMGLRLIIEPGRQVVGNSAIILSRVTYVKTGWGGRKFAILDAGMSDLIRPALYDAYHHIWPVRGPASPLVGRASGKPRLVTMDIVGPHCESSDCFAKDRRLPALKEGDIVAIFSAGAYGMSMSSNYNARPRACEVMVSGRQVKVIRKREKLEDLVRGE